MKLKRKSHVMYTDKKIRMTDHLCLKKCKREDSVATSLKYWNKQREKACEPKVLYSASIFHNMKGKKEYSYNKYWKDSSPGNPH